MAAMAMQSMNAVRTLGARKTSTRAQRSRVVVQAAADRKLWFPGAAVPAHLERDDLPANYGWDPLCLGSNPESFKWYQQAELQNGRWAMLGVAGILVQEILNPGVFWYNAGLPENLPDLEFGGKVNLGGLLAWEFLLMHWVEVRRWQDIKKHKSVDEDPIFKGNKLSNPELGYPGFNPFGLPLNMETKTKELKNARLAMVAFVGFTLQAQATGKGPLASLGAHLSDPFNNNILKNIGTCAIPKSVSIDGVTIPLYCLWPGQYIN